MFVLCFEKLYWVGFATTTKCYIVIQNAHDHNYQISNLLIKILFWISTLLVFILSSSSSSQSSSSSTWSGWANCTVSNADFKAFGMIRMQEAVPKQSALAPGESFRQSNCKPSNFSPLSSNSTRLLPRLHFYVCICQKRENRVRCYAVALFSAHIFVQGLCQPVTKMWRQLLSFSKWGKCKEWPPHPQEIEGDGDSGFLESATTSLSFILCYACNRPFRLFPHSCYVWHPLSLPTLISPSKPFQLDQNTVYIVNGSRHKLKHTSAG